jgi:hypothetical protein
MSTRSSTTRSGTIYKSDSLAEISTPEQTMAEPTGDQRDEPARQADPNRIQQQLLVQEMLRDRRSREAERAEERQERDEERRLREAKVAERERVRDEERRRSEG